MTYKTEVGEAEGTHLTLTRRVTMNRFDHLHKKYREEKMKARKEAILNKSRLNVETNGNGTSGYTIQEGKNKNKVAGHISVDHQNKKI